MTGAAAVMIWAMSFLLWAIPLDTGLWRIGWHRLCLHFKMSCHAAQPKEPDACNTMVIGSKEWAWGLEGLRLMLNSSISEFLALLNLTFFSSMCICLQHCTFSIVSFSFFGSWGTDWGAKGYIYMKKDRNICGIANMASYPVVWMTNA